MTPRDRANASQTQVLKRLPFGVAQEIAKAMNISDGEFSKLKNTHLAPVLLMLAHLDLKLVSADARCLDPVSFAFLTALQIRVSRKAPELQWEDSEQGSSTVPGELTER